MYRGVTMMIDPKISDVEMSYDPVADEYTRRIFIGFRQGDMRRLDVEDGEWGGGVAFYSIIHIRRQEVEHQSRRAYIFAENPR